MSILSIKKSLAVAVVALFSFALLFSFASAAGSVTVTSPASGAYWHGTQNIVWDVSSGTTLLQSLKLSYSSDFTNWSNSVPITTSSVSTVISPLSWDVSGITDGTYKVRVSGSGNATYGTSDTFNIDNTPPTTTYSVSPTSPDGTNGWYKTKPAITLTCTDPVTNGVSSGCSKINYAWYDASGVMVSTATATVTDTANSGDTKSITIPASNVPQGENILKWSSEDNAVDNSSPTVHNISTTHSQEFKVDTLAPTMAITPVTGMYVSGTKTFAFATIDPNLAYLEFTATLPNTSQSVTTTFAPKSNPYQTYTATTNGTGVYVPYSANKKAFFTEMGITSVTYNAASQTWTFTIDSTTKMTSTTVSLLGGTVGNPIWPDGTYNFTATVGDIAGNTKSATPSYIFDNTAPVITTTTLTAPNGDEDFAGGSGQTITWNAGDITDTNLTANPITLSYSTDSASTNPTWTQIATGEANDGTYTWTVPTGVNSINVKVKITATDKAGNTSNDVSDGVFTIDSTNPTLSPVSIVSNNSNTAYATTGNTVTLSFTSDEDIQVPTVTIAGHTATVSAVTTGSQTDWKASTTMFASDTQGVIPFDITFKDIAGNSGTNVTATTGSLPNVTFDNVKPNAPVITQIGATGNYINSVNVGTVHVTGTAEAGSTVSVTLTDNASTPVTTTTVTGTADASGAYDITVDASSLADGQVTATVNATDAAGNTSVDTTSTATKDVAAPTVSTITTKDLNKDGKIDTSVIVFGEPVKDTTFSASDFTIGGNAVTSISTGTANDDTITLSTTNEVAGTDAKTVAYTGTNATDIAGNAIATFSQLLSTDGAGPVLLSAETISTTEIDATFSENLNGSSVSASDFSVANNTVIGKSESNGVVTLTLGTAIGTGDVPNVTAIGDGTSGVEDSSSNWSPQNYPVTPTDGVAPTLSGVSIASNNTNAPTGTYAKEGDTVTLNFTSSETVGTPTVTIDGQTANVTSASGTDNWTAAYTMTSSDTQGTVPFTINFTDTAGNGGTQVTATDDSSAVFFDSVAPIVSAGIDREVNSQVVAQGATASDPTSNASGLDTYAWTQTGGPTGGTVTFSNQSGTGTGVDTNISADTDGVYILKLTVTDKAGNENSDTMTFKWDTTNPVEIASTPSNGAQNVSSTAGNVVVTFNEPITALDTSKVMFTNVSTSASAIDTSGTATISGNTIVIPHALLSDNVEYRINVLPGAVTDIAGNNLTVNFNHNFTTSATPDTTPPAVPVITTSATTAINANYYTITGTDVSDGGQRIVNLYNGTALAGSAVLASGQTVWSINSALTQNSDNVFTAKAVDTVGNVSGASASVTITEAAPAVVTPTVTLSGTAIATSYTAADAGTRFVTNGLQFTTTNADSVTVNGTSVTAGATVTAVSVTDAVTLGLHVYNVVVTSTTGNTANITVSYTVVADFNDTATLAVTGIDAVKTYAIDDNTYPNGWSWVYHITVPTGETDFQMKFSDFVSGANTVPAASNIRFFTAQASAHSGAIGITAANAFSIPPITLDGDLSPTTPGRQIDVTVEMKVPAGTAGGSYSGSYGVQTQTPQAQAPQVN